MVKHTQARFEDCPSACDTSCICCSQNFRNSFYHEYLNRHVEFEHITTWSGELTLSHAIPPEQHLVAMSNAAGLSSFETEQPIELSGGVVTRPDVYFHAPNEQLEGACIYLDGMSEHLHGNAQTAAWDRQIRDELLRGCRHVLAQ